MKFTFLKKSLILAALAAVFSLQSCSDDPDPVEAYTPHTPEAGFYIVNEGGFNNSNTSISFYDRKTNTVTNNIFANRNVRPLGDQTQSMTIVGDTAYILVQNSNKIEVINATTAESITTITTGIFSPRYLAAVSKTKAYVSDWGADGVTGTVKVLDLSTLTITNSIDVGVGANQMVKSGNYMYVASMGSYGRTENEIDVIDTRTDIVTEHISTGENPNSVRIDNNGNLWVACSGVVAYNEDFTIDEENTIKGSISKITPDHHEAFRLYVDEATYGGVTGVTLSADGTQAYYLFNDAIYHMSTTATTLPTAAFKGPDSYYGLAIDTYDGTIIGCKAPSYSAAGTIELINPNGTVKNTFTVGIIPNGCAFFN